MTMHPPASACELSGGSVTWILWKTHDEDDANWESFSQIDFLGNSIGGKKVVVLRLFVMCTT